MNLWIVASVDAELSRLKAELDVGPARALGRCTFHMGHIRGVPIYLGVLGVGVVSAALALGGLMAWKRADQVIMIGSAGALPGSGLEVGDVAVASSEVLAEIGLCTGPGLGDTVPLNLAGLHQEIPLDEPLSRSLIEAAQGSSRVVKNRFLTVVGGSADQTQAKARADRFQAVVENMEGYALAQAGQWFGVPVGTVRAVSNMAGDRNKSAWRLDPANELAQAIVLEYLRKTF